MKGSWLTSILSCLFDFLFSCVSINSSFSSSLSAIFFFCLLNYTPLTLFSVLRCILFGTYSRFLSESKDFVFAGSCALPRLHSLSCMSISQSGAPVQSPTVQPSKSWLSLRFLPLPCSVALPAWLKCPGLVESEKCSRHSERPPQSSLMRVSDDACSSGHCSNFCQTQNQNVV